jgi:hypothetical protein
MRDLDIVNRSMLWDTPESDERLKEFTRPEVYAGLFKHLGWDFSLAEDEDDAIPYVPLILIGHISAPDVGKVAVYCTSITSNPGLSHDQLEELAIQAMMMLRLNLKTPVLMMSRFPLVRSFNHPDTGAEQQVSVFGKIFFDRGVTWLTLPSKPVCFTDLFVDLVAEYTGNTSVVLDADFETALRFEHMRRRKNPRVVETDAVQPVINWSGTGWDQISFEPLAEA